MKKLKANFGVVLSDLHAPYHSQECLDLVCEVIRGEKPDTVVSVGDMLDMMAVMQHDKALDQRGITLNEELGMASEAIAQIEAAAGDARLILVEGNHENRLDRYISKVAPELAGLVDYKSTVSEWEVIPYGDYIRLGKLVITHDVGISGELSIFAAEKDFNGNVLTGHTHIQRWAVVGNGRGDSHVTASGGWLGDPKHANYVGKIKKQRNWSHGFNTFWILEDGTVFIQPVPIVHGQCVVNGRIYGSKK